MKTKIFTILITLFLSLGVYSQTDTIKFYKLGSSSFSEALAQQVKDIAEASGDYYVTWDKGGYTRLDYWVDGRANYWDWIEERLPIIENNKYDYVIVQTINWYYLNPDQHDSLFKVILPDMVSKIRSVGCEVILYDKFPWQGCYDGDLLENHNLFHVRAGVEAGIDKIAFSGAPSTQLQHLQPFDTLGGFFNGAGHPGTMQNYMAACNLSYLLTGVSPIGSTMDSLALQGFELEGFEAMATSTDPEKILFYEAFKDRVINGRLILTPWEMDTLQRAAFHNHQKWNATLDQCMIDASAYNNIMGQIEVIYAQYVASEDRCFSYDNGLGTEDLAKIQDSTKMFSDRVEYYANLYLDASGYDALKTDYNDFWMDYNSKFRDDVFYQSLITLEVERRDTVNPNPSEIARLKDENEVFLNILSLAAENMLMDRISPVQQAEMISTFNWDSPLVDYAPQFGQAQLDNLSSWAEVVAIRQLYFDVWLDVNLQDELRDNRYPQEVWLKADSLFGVAFDDFVVGYRTLNVSAENGIVTISPDEVMYETGTSVTLTAIPASGYMFDGWGGNASGKDNPLTISMDDDMDITAYFSLIPPGIIIDNSDPNVTVHGSVITRTGMVGMYGDDVYKIAVDQNNYLDYTPDLTGAEGIYDIFIWFPTGNSALDVPYVISNGVNTDTVFFDQQNKGGDWNYLGSFDLVNGDYIQILSTTSNNVRAYADAVRFVQNVTTYSLNVTSAHGMVTRNPNKGNFYQDENVELTAVASPGFAFDSWSGDLTGTVNPVTITMDADKNIIANYTALTYTVTFFVDDGTTPIEGADVEFNSQTKTTNASGEAVFANVSYATSELYHVSYPGFNSETGFVGVTADIAKDITLTEQPAATYTLTVNNGSGSGDYTQGAAVNIVADAPAAGKIFNAWTGNVTNVADVNAASTSITMPATATSISATYTDITYTITFYVSDGTNPVQDAAVTFNSTTVNTNASGQAVFSDVVYGTGLGYSVSKTGYNSASGSVDATADVTENVTISVATTPTYVVNITNGAGSGNYEEGATVNISADTPPSGQEFDQWTGDIFVLSSVTASVTSFTMPASAVSLTATYKDIVVPTYVVNITNGTGSGNYEEGATVNLSADAAPTGQEFDQWTGDVSVLTDASLTSTSFTMPASTVSLTATYKDLPPVTYTVTVLNGTGSGDYAEGETVTITADIAPNGQQFSHWSGDNQHLDDSTLAASILTVPAMDVSFTANYQDITIDISNNEIVVRTFPNPVTDMLTIFSTKAISSVRIISLSGKVLLSQEAENDILVINISGFNSGIYLVEVKIENELLVKKLVVK